MTFNSFNNAALTARDAVKKKSLRTLSILRCNFLVNSIKVQAP